MQTYLEWSLRENLVWKWVPILYYFYGHLPPKWYCPFWGIITLQFISSGPFSKKGCFTPSASRIPTTEKKNIRNVLCILYTQFKKPKYTLIHIHYSAVLVQCIVHSTFLYMYSIYVQMYNDQHCLSLLHRFFSDPLFHHKRKWHLILYQWCPPWRQCGVYFT